MMKRKTLSGLMLTMILPISCGKDSDDTKDKAPATTTQTGSIEKKQAAQRFRVELVWPNSPVAGSGTNYVKLAFVNTADESKPKSVDLKKLEPWMKAHGHGSKKAPEITRESDSTFLVKVFFSMEGPWELRIVAVVDGVDVDVEIPVEVKAP